jgi:EpsI family protein
MNMTGRLFLACAIVVAAQLVVVGIHQGTDPEPSPLPALGPDSLPQSVGDFVGRDEPMDERVVAKTSCDAMLNRAYENRLGDIVFVNVGVWTDYRLGIPHSPELCYPSAGWEFVTRREVALPVADGQQVNVKQFVFQRRDSQIAVNYWVHLGDETIAETEGIRALRQRLRTGGGKLPPLVKVMLHTDARDPAHAEAMLARFAVELFSYTNAIQ